MTAARRAMETARSHLLDQQDPAGYWQFDQPTQVEATAADLLFREFAGLRDADLAAATARWLRSRQLGDGGWAARAGDQADTSASVLAYCALRLAGDSPDAYHMALAAGWIRDAGGLDAAGLRVRAWLAMFGEVSWGELGVPPPEVGYLPARIAAHPVRPAVLSLALIAALRPARKLPFGLHELRSPTVFRSDRPADVPAPERQAPFGPARAAMLRTCAEPLIAGRLPDGSWPGAGPGWFFSLIALHLQGYSFEHPALARGLATLNSRAAWTQAAGGPARWLDIGDRAVHGSALAVLALSDAGLPAGHDALLSAVRWLRSQEVRTRSTRLASQPAGSTAVPRDCAAVLLALHRARLPGEADQGQAPACWARWLAGLQGSDGGWSPSAPAPGWLPPRGRRGHGRGASAELTGEVLAALAAAARPGSAAIRRAAVWLLRRQLPDGAWPGEQGTGDLPATCAVLPALIAAGVPRAKAPVRLAADWIVRRQNADGGWGYAAVQAGSAPSATARAVLALLAAGGAGHEPAIDDGVGWLIGAQFPDGSWAERTCPALAVTAPLRALGTYLAAAACPAVPEPRTGGTGPAGLETRAGSG